ncbi:hypothetical protein STENM327S_07487 [Streptomyces tendae]
MVLPAPEGPTTSQPLARPHGQVHPAQHLPAPLVGVPRTETRRYGRPRAPPTRPPYSTAGPARGVPGATRAQEAPSRRWKATTRRAATSTSSELARPSLAGGTRHTATTSATGISRYTGTQLDPRRGAARAASRTHAARCPPRGQEQHRAGPASEDLGAPLRPPAPTAVGPHAPRSQPERPRPYGPRRTVAARPSATPEAAVQHLGQIAGPRPVADTSAAPAQDRRSREHPDQSLQRVEDEHRAHEERRLHRVHQHPEHRPRAASCRRWSRRRCRVSSRSPVPARSTTDAGRASARSTYRSRTRASVRSPKRCPTYHQREPGRHGQHQPGRPPA